MFVLLLVHYVVRALLLQVAEDEVELPLPCSVSSIPYFTTAPVRDERASLSLICSCASSKRLADGPKRLASSAMIPLMDSVGQ